MLDQLTRDQEHGNTTKEECPNIDLLLLEKLECYPALLVVLVDVLA